MNFSRDEQTIVALCTPRGGGAIALIRLSGNDAITIVNSFSRLSSGKNLSDLPTHTIHHGYIIDHSNNDSIIDEVLFLLMHAPKTFTGDMTVEITCHNNPFIIEAIVNIAIKHGARPAKAGEFTQRAVMNGKLDLIQAEALNEVIHAPTQEALKLSLSQLKGSLSAYFAQIEEMLVNLLGCVEASFEFLDEEQRDFDFDAIVSVQLQAIQDKIQEVTRSFNVQQHIKEGIRIALIGSVNAGKSTLFNALLGKDRAIVADIEGTTRDSIEGLLQKEGAFWVLIDTAGLRQTADSVEREGIERSLIEARRADIVLLILDSSRSINETLLSLYKDLYTEFSSKCIVVANKIDQEQASFAEFYEAFSTIQPVRVAAKSNSGLGELETEIKLKIKALFEEFRSPYLLNARQYGLLTELSQKIDSLCHFKSKKIAYELVAYHIREILENFADLTGKTANEKMMDMVFSSFCIGK